MKIIGRTLAPVLAAGLLVTLGCREDTTSPTAAETTLALSTASTPLSFIQVSGGGRHSCGITTENRAYCWGSNASGQLGDGTTTQHLVPFPVAGTRRFRQVSAGNDHSCGVTTDNRAYCWGQGASGQLGDGTSTDRLTPVSVAGGHLFRLVESGQFHTCGVSYPDNKAYCWGYNGSDELGDGTSTNRSAPVAVSGGRQFRQVSAGAFHTCGVTILDKAFCWGYNRYGQLGDGSTVIRSPTPSAVVGTRRFRQVDVGLYHTCGVTTSDRAFCWGYGRNGQMGDGNTTVSSSPKAVAGGFSF
jgi:alpha-tubulin suppressor-like RCC1 family protein